MSIKVSFSKLAISLVTVWLTIVAAACTPTSTTSTPPTTAVQEASPDAEPTEAAHDEGGEHTEGEAHEETGEHERLPNEGAVIRIVSPADGATFGVDEEIVVEIETENFVLGEDERHWELYVDGASWGSVEGGNQDEVVRGLEPGEHEITVYLSLGSHEQLEDGSTRHITVTE